MAQFDFYLNGLPVSEPVGFDQIKFNIIRSENHGIDQPFTNEVTFTGDNDLVPGFTNGAELLRLTFQNEFINGSVDIEIVSDFKVDGSIWSFTGKIDFSTYEEVNICDGCSDGVTVSIIEDDFREQFRSRSDVEVDLLTTLSLDGNYISALRLDTIRLHTQELYLVGKARNTKNQVDSMAFDRGAGWRLEDFATLLPTYFENSDFKNIFGTTFDARSTNYTTTSPIFVNNSTFARTITIKATADGVFSWGLAGFSGDTANITLSIQVKNVGGTETQRFYLYDSPLNAYDDPVDTAWDFNVSQTITLGADDRVFIFMQWGSNGTVKVGITPSPIDNSRNLRYLCENCCVTITETNSSAFASECQGLYVFNYLKRIIEIITGDPDGLVSDYFSIANDGCQWNNFLTTGLYIRNAATIDQILDGCGTVTSGTENSIKATFKRTFENLARIFCLGWEFEPDGYNGYKIRIEPVEYFYQPDVYVDFIDVDIKRNAIADDLVNSIAHGYSDRWKNISVSGIFAIHTERNYFVANKALENNTSNKLDLKSDIIAEGYCIEVNRRWQFLVDDSGSSDRPNDYDTFIIWLNKEELTINPIQGTGYQFENETGSVTFAPGTVSYGSDLIGANNSPIDRIYNVLHTPARVATRWWKWNGQQVFGLPTIKAQLSFQSGQYFTNFAMAVPDPCGEITDAELSEDSDISEDVTGTYAPGPLVQPIGYEFEVPQLLCDFLDMGLQGKKIIRFRCGSSIFAGYIMRAENQPGADNGGMTKFTLIGTETPADVEGSYSNGYSNGYG